MAKFRAWDINTKEMFYKYIALLPDGRVMDKEFQGFWQVNPALIPMLCTEVRDINDKEIYEGDIMRTLQNNALVEYVDSYTQFQLNWGDEGTGMIDTQRYEVIGNIYENSELLRG